jgi:hypothetical protein
MTTDFFFRQKFHFIKQIFIASHPHIQCVCCKSDRTDNNGQLFQVVSQIGVRPKFCLYELTTKQIQEGYEVTLLH